MQKYLPQFTNFPMKYFIRKVVSPFTIIAFLFTALGLTPFLVEPKEVSGETDETTYYFLTDHLGSVDAVLDDQGNVVERRDYLPYGQERSVHEELNSPETDYGFTGKELDSETGLNYYGARYYDPVTGRFIQMDPILMGLDKMSQEQRNAFLSNPQNLNAYAYVQNNPVRYTDPTGMYGEDVHYDLTYHLAIKAGLSEGQARIIAYRNQYVDDNQDTAPSKRNFFSNPAKIDRYHFQSRKIATENLLAAIESKSSPNVGTALHIYQDTYSHANLTQIQHIELNADLESPDRTYADAPKAFEMAKKSFFFLRLHNLRTNGSGDMSASEYRIQGIEIWNNMQQEIQNYLELEDKSDTFIAKEAEKVKNE